MNVRDAILQRLTDRIMRMRQALERFDDASAEREKVGPKWNVRDLVGHFVYWTDEAARRIPRIAAGTPEEKYDMERINDEVYKKNRRMSFVMLLPQLRAAEERLQAAIRAAPPDQLVDTPLREWIDEAGVRHYDHHWPGLRTAAERVHRG
jgi:hypothetical protein